MTPKKVEYVPLPSNETSTATSDVPPSDEAVRVQRAMIRRSMDERFAIDADPVDALRALLASPPQT